MEIMKGLQQCSGIVGRHLYPILSRRLQNPERDHSDAMVQRLDKNFPERDSSYKDESRFVETSDASTVSSRAETPTSTRRGSVIEEMRRQSAVFFDDPDLYSDDSTK